MKQFTSNKSRKDLTKAWNFNLLVSMQSLIQIIHESDLNQVFLAETFYLSLKL
ncbi:MAG: hypothetical protein IPG55_01490 [Saprospiraceae bacterium]|nr:hypothetical protein [Candidatus Defluviibacterium haderslevense]